jgi:hypothetical protein
MKSPELDVLNRNIYFQTGYLAMAHLYNHGFFFWLLVCPCSTRLTLNIG